MPRRRWARISLGQVVVAEVTLAVLAVASWGPAWVLLGVGALAAAVCVATFGRTGGRWWYQAAASQRRFARRRRRVANDVVTAALRARTPATVVWLRTLAPELTVRAVRVADRQVGVGTDGAGWFGALSIKSGTAIESGTWIEPERLADLLTPGPDRGALSTVQVVSCGRQTWVAVRLSPVDAVDLENNADPVEVRAEAAVAMGVIRATRLLAGAGYESVALDADGLVAALAAANGLDAAPQEHWSSWSSGSLAHTTYEASAVPAALPGVWAVAVSLGRDPALSAGQVALVGVLVRVAAAPAALAATGHAVVRAATRAGVRLRRLDGDQAPAAYACGPSALPGNAVAARSPSSPRIMAGRRDH